MNVSLILNTIPTGLRGPLIKEYNLIVQNYLEQRWTPSELSGGKFCEVVYTILKGFGTGTYNSIPSKPSNFVDACRRLENVTGIPRSFRILIPRMLPALYEIRNNRSVGHVGGDVDSNKMDAQAVIQISGWIMGELVRVYHNIDIQTAQSIVDSLTERKLPLIWELDGVKRVIKPKLKYPKHILLLLSTQNGKTDTDTLYKWLDYSNKTYYKKMLKQLHKDRLIDLSKDEKEAIILPPGIIEVERIIMEDKRTLTKSI